MITPVIKSQASLVSHAKTNVKQQPQQQNARLDDIFSKASDEDDDLDRLVASYIDNQNPHDADLNNNNTMSANNQNLIESMMLEDEDMTKNYCELDSNHLVSVAKSAHNFINQNNHLLIRDDDDDDGEEHGICDDHGINTVVDEDEDDDEEDEEYDEQTHITTLHEFV